MHVQAYAPADRPNNACLPNGTPAGMCGARWSRNRDADTRTVGHSGRTGPRSASLISDSRSGTGTASSGFRNIRACRNSRPSGISAPAAGKRSSTARTGNASVGGLPDYKSRHHAQPTLNYRIGGFRLVETDGAFRSKLTKGTVIPVVWSRGLPSAPTSVRVYRKPNGKWFASFVVETKPEDDMPHTGNAVGIDWGGAGDRDHRRPRRGRGVRRLRHAVRRLRTRVREVIG